MPAPKPLRQRRRRANTGRYARRSELHRRPLWERSLLRVAIAILGLVVVTAAFDHATILRRLGQLSTEVWKKKPRTVQVTLKQEKKEPPGESIRRHSDMPSAREAVRVDSPLFSTPSEGSPNNDPAEAGTLASRHPGDDRYLYPEAETMRSLASASWNDLAGAADFVASGLRSPSRGAASGRRSGGGGSGGGSRGGGGGGGSGRSEPERTAPHLSAEQTSASAAGESREPSGGRGSNTLAKVASAAAVSPSSAGAAEPGACGVMTCVGLSRAQSALARHDIWSGDWASTNDAAPADPSAASGGESNAQSEEAGLLDEASPARQALADNWTSPIGEANEPLREAIDSLRQQIRDYYAGANSVEGAARDSNDDAFIANPEPGSFVLAAAGLAVLLRARRRRRSPGGL